VDARLEVGEVQGGLLGGRVEQAVLGEDGGPGAAVDGVLGLHQPGEVVGQRDRRLAAVDRDRELRGVVVDQERGALAIPRQGLFRTVRRPVSGDHLDLVATRGERRGVPGVGLLRDRRLGQGDPGGPALLTGLDDVVHLVVVGVGHLPTDIDLPLLRRAVGDVGDLQLGDLGMEVGRSVGDRHRPQVGRAFRVLGREPGAVLDEPADGDVGLGGLRVGLLGRPWGPGGVGLADVPGADLERDRGPLGGLPLPAHRAEAAGELGVEHVRDQLAALDDVRGEPHHRPRIAGADQQAAAGLGQQGEDLAVVEFGDGRVLGVGLADLVEHAVGPGPHQQSVVEPGDREDQRTGPEDLAHHARGLDAIDRVLPRLRRLRRGRSAGGRLGGVLEGNGADMANHGSPRIRENDPHPPFSPRGRRWPEGPDEGGATASRRIGNSFQGDDAPESVGGRPLIRPSATFSHEGRRMLVVGLLERCHGGVDHREQIQPLAPRLGRGAGVEGAVVRDQERADFRLRRIIEDARLAVGGDAEDQALAVAAGVGRSVGADGHRKQMGGLGVVGQRPRAVGRAFPELAVRPGGREQVPLRVGREVPDVEDVRGGTGLGMLGVGQLDDLPRGARPREDLAVGRGDEAEGLAVGVVEDQLPALRVLRRQPEDLPRVAGCGVDRAVGRPREVPDPIGGEGSGGDEGPAQPDAALVGDDDALAAMLGESRRRLLPPRLQLREKLDRAGRDETRRDRRDREGLDEHAPPTSPDRIRHVDPRRSWKSGVRPVTSTITRARRPWPR